MTDNSFNKDFRLLSVRDFSNLKEDSQSLKATSCIIYFKKNSFNKSRIGISVSKKIGNSVIRNRFKRIIREFFRNSNFKFLGFDMLVVVSFNRLTLVLSHSEKETVLLKDISHLFSKIK